MKEVTMANERVEQPDQTQQVEPTLRYLETGRKAFQELVGKRGDKLADAL